MSAAEVKDPIGHPGNRLSSRVLVAMVFHSDTDALASCIASLCTEGLTGNIVVCDTSANGVGRAIAVEHGVLWCDGSRNAGYAWASQLVADAYPDYDVIVVSNSDVCFVDGALGRLISHSLEFGGVCYGLQKTSEGAVASYSVHSQLSARESIARWTGIGRRRFRTVVNSVTLRGAQSTAPVRIPSGFAGSGAVIVVPKDIWLKSGGLDPDYFLFDEDRSFGKELEHLGIPAYLCGDCEIIHDGGFRSRDRSVAAILECVISEQISWRKQSVGANFVLFSIQLVGLLTRMASAMILGRWHDVTVYSTVLRMVVKFIRGGTANLYGEDGLRVPATDSWFDHRHHDKPPSA
jgi:GT2 family glycosyltransferase